MSFLSDLFKRKPAKPEPPRTREEMEASLSVHEQMSNNIQTPQGTLQNTFQRKRPALEEEKKLLKETFDLIASVPQGKKLLDEVAKSGYEIYFEAFRSGNLGCMYAEQKKIMLCPCAHTSVAEMATSAFHEMTHAVQHERTGYLGTKSAELTLADQFKFHRAAEAAAWTEEAKFAYQIREQHPEVEKLASDFPMYKAFVDEMEKSGDMGKAGEACFKSWYGFKHYQNVYENNHVGGFSYHMNQKYIRRDNMLYDNISSEDVLKNVFISDDLRQGISPEFLTSKEAFSVSESAIEALDQSAIMYNKGKTDPSLRNMYSYETGKTYASQEKPKEAVAASARPQKSSVMTSLTQIDKAEKAKKNALAVKRELATGR